MEDDFPEEVRLPDGTVVKAPGLNEHHRRLKAVIEAEREKDPPPRSETTGQ